MRKKEQKGRNQAKPFPWPAEMYVQSAKRALCRSVEAWPSFTPRDQQWHPSIDGPEWKTSLTLVVCYPPWEAKQQSLCHFCTFLRGILREYVSGRNTIRNGSLLSSRKQMRVSRQAASDATFKRGEQKTENGKIGRRWRRYSGTSADTDTTRGLHERGERITTFAAAAEHFPDLSSS